MQIDKNNWQIKIDEENREEVVDYFILKYTGKDYMREIGRVNFGGEFLSIHDYQIPFLTHYQDSNIPLITTDQFRKYILGKEDRKIIGYKAPFDMGNGEIKEGDVFIIDLEETDDWYIRKFDRSFGFPKELVESYFIPVYEEEEKVIELHGWKVTKDKILNIEGRDCRGLIFKCFKEYSEIIKAYKELNKSHEIHTNII